MVIIFNLFLFFPDGATDRDEVSSRIQANGDSTQKEDNDIETSKHSSDTIRTSSSPTSSSSSSSSSTSTTTITITAATTTPVTTITDEPSPKRRKLSNNKYEIKTDKAELPNFSAAYRFPFCASPQFFYPPVLSYPYLTSSLSNTSHLMAASGFAWSNTFPSLLSHTANAAASGKSQWDSQSENCGHVCTHMAMLVHTRPYLIFINVIIIIIIIIVISNDNYNQWWRPFYIILNLFLYGLLII